MPLLSIHWASALTYIRCTLRLACETFTGIQHRLRHSSALEFGINYDTTRHVQGGGGGGGGVRHTLESSIKVSKGAKIRNRYSQVPHLTQDTNGKVTNSQ